MPGKLNKPTLSVVVPALNEEANLAATLHSISSVVSRYFSAYEIIVFNDGSKDGTGALADKLASKDCRIRVIHHRHPKNLGGCYAEGVALATMDYLVMIPGDNECGIDVMDKIFQLVGQSDLVIPFTNNPEVRPVSRRIISKAFVWLLNLASGCRLQYYNGAVVHRTDLLRKYGIRTNSFGYQADVLVRMIRNGLSYREVGTAITFRPAGRSKAFRISNIWRVGQFIVQLFLELRLNPLIGRHAKSEGQ